MAYWSSITDCSYKPCVPHQQPRLTTQKGKKKKKRKQQIKRNGYCSKMMSREAKHPLLEFGIFFLIIQDK